MNRVIISDLYKKQTQRALRTQKILLFCMKSLKLKNTEVHLTFIDDAKMKTLNRTYRNKNKTTDVLSFGMHEQMGKKFFLGDIAISVAQASKQAITQKHRVKDELAVLTIHGLLHLLGYDHEKKKDEIKMFSIQNELHQQTYSF